MTTLTPVTDSVKQRLLTEFCAQHDDAIFILDADMCYVTVNSAYEAMIGFDHDFLIGRPLAVYDAEFLLADERLILEHIATCLHTDGIYDNEFSMAPRYGQSLEWHVTCRKVLVDENIYYLGMARNISEVVSNKKRVAQLLNFNQTTGLPNSNIFSKEARERLLHSDQQVYLMRLNIDRYRVLASTLGCEKINALIKQFVNQIHNLKLDNLYCFAHFGGDDFALLFQSPDITTVRQQVASIMHLSEHAYIIDNRSLYLHISIGISHSPDHGTQYTGLLNKAEKALQYIKQQGGDSLCWYNNELQVASVQSLELEVELRQALNKHEFVLYYQPKIELKTGAISGFEALVRWQHPIRGLLQPAEFIDAIIRHKLSFDLFCQMAVQIAKQLNLWQALGVSQSISINANATEFNHPEFLGFVSRLMSDYGIEPHQLHIEVTESSLMVCDDDVSQRLIGLKNLNICLALDDFGTGYSSLSYLHKHPFDFIKIDKSFITEIATSRAHLAIVKAILDLTIALDMSAIAEGIETHEQLNTLTKMDCAYGQGYLFSKPIPASAATKMLSPSFA